MVWVVSRASMVVMVSREWNTFEMDFSLKELFLRASIMCKKKRKKKHFCAAIHTLSFHPDIVLPDEICTET